MEEFLIIHLRDNYLLSLKKIEFEKTLFNKILYLENKMINNCLINTDNFKKSVYSF